MTTDGGPARPATKALEDIASERHRQIEVEGWTPEHDDCHAHGELAAAAATYAVLRSHVGAINGPGSAMLEELWPWNASWWKPTSPRRDLIKAGALIVAEIERLDRLAARGGNNG